MAYSKLVAYDNTGGVWKRVTRWNLINMSEVKYKEFHDTHFPLYISKSEKSAKLHFNRGQKTFRFYADDPRSNKFKGAKMTISHLIAQEALSELRHLKFTLTDVRTKPYIKDIVYEIEVDQAFLETKVTVDKTKNEYYFADVLVHFSKPEWLAYKWGGYVALEVLVTHEVGGEKSLGFNKVKLPMIEIELGPKLIVKKSLSRVTEEEETEIRKKIWYSFMKGIRGKIKVSTTSNAYLQDKTVQTLANKIEVQSESLENLTKGISGLKDDKSVLQDKISEYEAIVSSQNKLVNATKKSFLNVHDKKQKMDSQLKEWNEKSIFSKMIHGFRVPNPDD